MTEKREKKRDKVYGKRKALGGDRKGKERK